MTLVSLLSAVAGFIKVRFLADKEVIDNAAFRLHYKVTAAIFFAGCILCTANSLIGDPIQCMVDDDKIQKPVNTYCWISATFTLPKHLHKRVGVDVPHDGIGPHVPGQDDITLHAYYQWVPFVLFLQGVLFYLPHWIWKTWEQGTMKSLSDGIRGVEVATKSDRKVKHSRVIQYLLESLNTHNGYALRYVTCEVLNFANAVGNIYFIDTFLGGAFLTFGTKVLQFSNMDQQNRTDPMIEVFPRVTKCTFHKFGSSGTIQNLDALCVMAMNILNEKIYIFLWFWLILMAVISGLAMLYSFANVILPTVRKSVMRRIFHVRPTHGLTPLMNKLSFGDFFMLHLIGQNVDAFTFTEIIDDMSKLIHDFKGNYSPDVPYKSPYHKQPSHLEMTPMYPTVPKNAEV